MSSPPGPALVATATRGVEPWLAEELRELGLEVVSEERGAVRFRAGEGAAGGLLGAGYRACLWSRIASRVLLPLRRIQARDAESLYREIRRIPWSEHLGPDQTFAVDFVGTSPSIRNSRFGALKVKDGICDRIRGDVGRRPSVDLDAPDVRINVHLRRNHASAAIDLSGAPLHRRGWRRIQGPAPLKETLAAAMLRIAGWPALAREGAPLVDPLCGSGTLLIEAALVALDRAPGLLRDHWGFLGWRGHEPDLWLELLGEARERAQTADRLPIFGADVEPRAVAATRENAAAAGVDGLRVSRRDAADARPPDGSPGLLITNPPYDERLRENGALYRTLGDVMRRRFLGWTGFLFTSSPELARQIGLRPDRRTPLFNGPLECRLLRFPISAEPPKGAPGWRGDPPG